MRFVANRGFDGLLVVLGIAAVLCMLGPAIALVAALSVIGLPITFLMAIVPTLFLFLLAVRLAMLALPFRHGWIPAAAVALAIFTAVPWSLNQRLESEARALAAGDFDNVTKPFDPRSLAVTGLRQGFDRNQTPCDDFCLRALLSGSLSRVLVATEKDLNAPLDPAMEAISFRMERRGICPAVDLRPGVGRLDVDRGSGANRVADASELMRLEISAGNCLIQEPAKVGDAAAVVRIGRIKQGKTPYAAGLDLFADTVRADRIALWERTASGYKERYRWTGVLTWKLVPVLAPSYVTGYGLEIGNGFLRTSDRINIASKYYEAPDRTAFFTGTLGLALELDATSTDELRTAALNQRLGKPGGVDAVAPQIAADFFQDIVMRRTLTLEQAQQGLRIVEDERIPVPRGVYVLARYGEKLPADIQRRTGDVLIGRLFALDRPVERAERSGWTEQVSALGGAIRVLPEPALAGHRDALERLARREALRVPGWQALVRLSDFGGRAVPTLLHLIEDAERFRKARGNDWQHPYLAGLIGICRLGQDGGAALGPLLRRIDSGLMPMHASYGKLTVNTLVAIGGSTEQIWQRVQAADPKADRKRFDHTVSRAKSEPDCSY